MTPDDFATALKHQMRVSGVTMRSLEAETSVDKATIWRITKGLAVSSHSFLKVFTWLLEAPKGDRNA